MVRPAIRTKLPPQQNEKLMKLADAEGVTLECDFGIVLSNPSGDIVSRSGETNLLGSSATNENTVSLMAGTILTIGTWIMMMIMT